MKMQLTLDSIRSKTIGFAWQHTLLLLSLFIMTLGVALSIKSALGSSVISTIPFVMTLAGKNNLITPLSIGQWTIIMNFILIGLQILILRRNFQLVQLFQLIIGYLFGSLLDLNIALTDFITINNITTQILAQIAGCIILGAGIALEVKCGSVTMPGEGLPAAITKKFGIPFPKAKICVDIALVLIAVALGYHFLGSWPWIVVGPGTLFAMIFVGIIVRLLSPHLTWFDRLLCYRPGFRRHIYGLARILRSSH